MTQIRIRLKPNVYAALYAVAREQKLKGGLSELCGRLITSFVLDGFEFSKFDQINRKIDELSGSVARLESAPRAFGLTEDQDNRLRASVGALAKIIKLLESASDAK